MAECKESERGNGQNANTGRRNNGQFGLAPFAAPAWFGYRTSVLVVRQPAFPAGILALGIRHLGTLNMS